MSQETFIERLVGKLDELDPDNIQAYILRLSRERGFLDTIFNTIHEGIIVIDKRLRIRYQNKAAEKLLGLPEKAANLRISQFLRDVDWKRLLQEDAGEWYRLSRQEIEVFYPVRRIIHFYLVPHESRKGIATIILQDVTEFRKHADDRVESEKIHVISMLAASVAHEIGNPLNSLYRHLQLMQKQLAEEEEIDRDDFSELLEISRSEVERLDTIISQFLKAVRPQKPEMVMLDLKAVIIETLTFMKTEIANRAVEVKCEWNETLPEISGDRNQLRQAFYNIIKNALQAMPEGGTIEIKCEFDDDFLTLSIADSGQGISLDDIGDIFDPYYTSKQEGTGLGLMIVERILRAHGAELAINTKETLGTDFVIRFPRHGKRMRLLPAPPCGNEEVIDTAQGDLFEHYEKQGN